MKLRFLNLAIIAMAVSLAACSSENNDEPNKFEGIYYDETTSDRAYFESVATKVLTYIKANDQKNATVALNYFVNYCDEYEFPQDFYDKGMSKMPRVKDVETPDDLIDLSRAVAATTVNLSAFKGLYQANPQTKQWQFIENRDDLVFRFWISNAEYNIIISSRGNEWQLGIEDYEDRYLVNVPSTINFTLVSGGISSGNNLITLALDTDIKDGSQANITTSLRYANMQLESTTKSTDTKLVEDAILYHHNPSSYVRTTLLSTHAEVTGSGLCSSDAWDKVGQSEDPAALASVITGATATSMLYSSIQAKSAVTDVRTFCNNIDGYWCSYDYPDARARAESAAKALASAVSTELRYCGDNQNKVRATLGWEAYIDDDAYSHEDWMVRPTITFASDGATYDIESYFGNGRFLTIENNIKNLIKTYRSFWK